MPVKTIGTNSAGDQPGRKLLKALAGLSAGAVMYGLLSAATHAEALDVDNYDDPDSVELALERVPPKILSVVEEARPGLYITRVVKDLEADDDHYYRFEGTQVGRFWTVEVRADGKLIKVREQDDPFRQPD